MKKLLQSTFLFGLVLLFACNDANNNADNDATNDDTSNTSATADTSNAAANSMMSKNGLPLSADQEVPANKSSGKGTADVTYNKETKMLTYTVNYSGLTGKANMAHIHGTAARGTNAGVVHDLTGKLQKDVSGSFTDSVKVGDKINEDSLLAGKYYFNVHTPKNPSGEIRGQIEF